MRKVYLNHAAIMFYIKDLQAAKIFDMGIVLFFVAYQTSEGCKTKLFQLTRTASYLRRA